MIITADIFIKSRFSFKNTSTLRFCFNLWYFLGALVSSFSSLTGQILCPLHSQRSLLCLSRIVSISLCVRILLITATNAFPHYEPNGCLESSLVPYAIRFKVISVGPIFSPSLTTYKTLLIPSTCSPACFLNFK